MGLGVWGAEAGGGAGASRGEDGATHQTRVSPTLVPRGAHGEGGAVTRVPPPALAHREQGQLMSLSQHSPCWQPGLSGRRWRCQVTDFPVFGRPAHPRCSLRSRSPLGAFWVPPGPALASVPHLAALLHRAEVAKCCPRRERGLVVAFWVAPASHGNRGEVESTGERGPPAVTEHMAWERQTACASVSPVAPTPEVLGRAAAGRGCRNRALTSCVPPRSLRLPPRRPPPTPPGAGGAAEPGSGRSCGRASRCFAG